MTTPLTTPAWLLIIGCGVCLALAVGMAVAVAALGKTNRNLRAENRSLLQDKEDLTCTIKSLVPATCAPATSAAKNTPPSQYTIREEEYV